MIQLKYIPSVAFLVAAIVCLFIILTINDDQPTTPVPKTLQCVPHSRLEKRFGLPDPCDDSQIIIDCADPYLHYLKDPHVLASCALTNVSTVPELRQQVKKAPSENGISQCPSREGVLVSTPSLPVAPVSPTPGLVPNMVHYVSLGCNRTFSFTNYLSVLSVHRFVKPSRIFFHGDCLPKGRWWKKTLIDIPNIYFRKRVRTKLIQGVPPMWVEHETDIIRLQILLEEGGIYLDTDVLILAPLDDLRPHEVSLGRELPNSNRLLGSSFILAQPRAPFLCLWLYAFREYVHTDVNDWSRYAIITPGKISMEFPAQVHVEKTRFYQPSWFEVQKIYSGFYDWSENYILHMWNNRAKNFTKPNAPSEIPARDKITCTLHEIVRYIYFDEITIHAKKQSVKKD